MKAKKIKNKIIQVRINNELYRAIVLLSKKHKVSKSDVIRDALDIVIRIKR